MPPNSEPFLRGKQGVRSAQAHRPRISEWTVACVCRARLNHSEKKKPRRKRCSWALAEALNPFVAGFFFSLTRHTQATVQIAHSRSATLHALHALFYTVKRLIDRWHAALFTLLHYCCRVLQKEPIVKLAIIMQIQPFHFLTTHKGQSPYIQEPG